MVPDERLFQIFALQQLPYTEELAKQQFGIVYAGLPPRSTRNAAASDTGSAHTRELGRSGVTSPDRE